MEKYRVYPILVLIAVLCFVPGELLAGTLFQQVGIASSPNPVGSGARAMGMGGAFIGVADDATAASWNPGGLIQLEKPELSIVADYSYRRETFASGSRPEIDNTGDVDDSEINYFSAAYPFFLFRNMVVSINYQRLYDYKRSFDYRLDYSSGGVDLIQDKSYRQDGFVGALGLAGSIQLTPKISFGATLNIWTDELFWDNGWNETFNEIGVGTTGGVPTTILTHIDDKYSRFRGINANVGLLWDINQYLTVGTVFKAPFEASLLHEYDYQQTQIFGDPLNSTVVSRQSLKEDVELDMPMSFGVGLAWRFSDAFTMDFDVYWTDWSKYMLTDDQGNKFSPVDGRPKDESDVDDTIQARLGGEYLFILEDKHIAIPVRAGVFYDPEPSEGSPKDFYGFAIGSGIAYKQFIFDVAYQFRWGDNVDTGNLIATSEADIEQHKILTSIILHF